MSPAPLELHFESIEPPQVKVDFGYALGQALQAFVAKVTGPGSVVQSVKVPIVASREMALSAAKQMHLMAYEIEAVFAGSSHDDGQDEDEPPTKEARARASALVAEAHAAGLHVDEVDSDVLGGMGLLFFGGDAFPDRRAWIACMNAGHTSIVLTDEHGNVSRVGADASPWDRIKLFLGR